MLLIGSKAVAHFIPEYLDERKTVDWDFICTLQEFKETVTSLIKGGSKLKEISFVEGANKSHAKFYFGEEFYVIEASLIDRPGQLQESDKQIYEMHQNNFDKVEIAGVDVACYIASIGLNYVLKCSHKYKKNSKHFLKTLNDIKFLRESMGEIISEFMLEHFAEVYSLRSKLTYNNSLPKLNTSKEMFFTDSVPYKYDHDDLHLAVKHLDKPAYQYYIKDGEEVFCCVKKFFDATEEVRLYGVLEEAYVLALERSVIPHGTNPKLAFDVALEKVCTSITSGWFREFAYDNYHEVQALYNANYVDKFITALQDNRIKYFQR